MASRNTRPCLTPMELDRCLSDHQADEALRAHLADCAACRAALEEHRANDDMLYLLQSSNAEAAPASSGGAVVDGFDVLEEIHRGAQGVVYRAVQKSARRVVALKVLLAGTFATSSQRLRFEREIELVAGLDHPNIVTVFESGRTKGGQLYFAMQYVEGETFSDWTKRQVRSVPAAQRKVARRKAIERFVTICKAVHHAHLHGVIHRDLKPANILIDRAAEPHVVDFGLAKIDAAVSGRTASDVTQPGVFMGTAVYASPEQAAGDPAGIDLRSDVYALGVMLYELIAGSLPFDESQSLTDVLRALAEHDPPKPRDRNRTDLPIDGDLETIVLKAMSRDRERRYQSAAALADDLERYLAGRAIEARRDSAWYLLRKSVAQHKTVAIVAAAFVLLLAGSSVAMTLLYQRAANQAEKVRTINIFLEDTMASIEPGRAGVSTMHDFFDEARHWIELVLGNDSEAEASVRLIVGNGYRNIGRLADAEHELMRSVELRRELYGEQHVEFARGLNALGQLRFDEGNFADAASLIERAMAIRIDQLGEASLDVAFNQATLARVRIAQSRRGEAGTLLRASLDTRQALLGPEHPDVAMAIFSLAELARLEGRPDEALALHDQALRIRRSSLHELHPDLARSLLALGAVLRERAQPESARPLLAEAVSLRERALPRGHWRVAEAQCELAACLADLGERGDAYALSRSAFAALRAALGDHDPRTVQAASQLADLDQ